MLSKRTLPLDSSSSYASLFSHPFLLLHSFIHSFLSIGSTFSLGFLLSISHLLQVSYGLVSLFWSSHSSEHLCVFSFSMTCSLFSRCSRRESCPLYSNFRSSIAHCPDSRFNRWKNEEREREKERKIEREVLRVFLISKIRDSHAVSCHIICFDCNESDKTRLIIKFMQSRNRLAEYEMIHLQREIRSNKQVLMEHLRKNVYRKWYRRRGKG
jgi:hypothetical protein